MANEYISDDRNVLENAQKIRSMTDEEFEEYIKYLEKKQTEEDIQSPSFDKEE